MKLRNGPRMSSKYEVVGWLAKVLCEGHNEYSLRKSALYRLFALDESQLIKLSDCDGLERVSRNSYLPRFYAPSSHSSLVNNERIPGIGRMQQVTDRKLSKYICPDIHFRREWNDERLSTSPQVHLE